MAVSPMAFWRRIHSTEAVYIKVLSNITAMLLAAALSVCCAPFAAPSVAFADEVSDAQNALDSAEAQLQQISAEHEALVAQADALQAQIDDAIQGVLDAQSSVQEGRLKLGTYASQEYKMGGLSLVQVLLDSQNIADLINNMRYFEAIQQEQAREIEQQKQREEAFNEALDDLNEKKDSQQKAIADAASKEKEATQVVASATAKLSDAQAAAEAARLAELQRQAEALQAQQDAEEEASSADDSSGGNADSGSSDSGSNANTNSGSNENNSGNSGSDSSSDTTDDSGWTTGLASAYGAESDGTLGGRTANGSIVTETSMGVAIPLAWNKRYLLGRTVEISYGGRTVLATINDLGGMGGGSRSLDLQPGVWRAFGASSCFDWGVRTVSYRIL